MLKKIQNICNSTIDSNSFIRATIDYRVKNQSKTRKINIVAFNKLMKKLNPSKKEKLKKSLKKTMIFLALTKRDL